MQTFRGQHEAGVSAVLLVMMLIYKQHKVLIIEGSFFNFDQITTFVNLTKLTIRKSN